MMKLEETLRSKDRFDNIRMDMIDRLDREAEQRTLRPQSVDWDEIHRQAALARSDS